MKNKKRNRSALKLVNAPEPEEGHNNSPKCVDPRNALNDLLAKEWIPETISVWSQKGLGAGHADAKIEKQHPAPFSYTDVSRLIRFFTKKGGLVLDPFVGIGSTLKACALEGRKGIGIELNPHFVRLARERLTKEVNEIFASDNEQKVIKGDSRIVVDTLKPDSLDFVVTSPPYWSILKKKEDHKVRQERLSLGLAKDYGNDSRDLGNVKNYDEFLEQLGIILGKCVKALKPGKYMAVIVSDFRDKSRFLMFHADLARELEKRGLQMRGLKVLYQRHKKIFPYGYPYAYVPNIHNQFILILQKPQHKK